MAFFDQTLLLSSNQAITVTAASTNVYDVTGAGSGIAPSMSFGNTAVGSFGMDIGVGDGAAVPYLYLTVGTAFVTGGGATLQVSIQASPSSANSPSGYVNIYSSQLFTAAQLVAGATLLVPVPPFAPIELGETLPRFYRVNYTVGTSTFSAGTVTAVLLLNAPAGLVSTLYSNNFVQA